MKLTGAVLTIAVCMGLAGCSRTPPAPAAAPDTNVAKVTREEHVETRLYPLSPYIADGTPGVFGPDEDFTLGNFYGVIHGQSTLVGGWIEQWFLATANETISQDLSLKEFPNFLPLATATSGSTKMLYWGFGMKPKGVPSSAMKSDDFYKWVTTELLKDHIRKVRYGLGFALSAEGAPPMAANGGLDDDTPGVMETISITNLKDCHWSVFALPPQRLDIDLLEKNGIPTFNWSRRVLQAWTKACGPLDTIDPKRTLGETSKITNATYQYWVDSMSSWKDVNRADGIVLIDDNFVPFTTQIEEVKKRAISLLSR